jgi:SAM-dependent methyltransferase
MPLAPDVLRSRLAAQQWTAHNIVLTPEIMTVPGQHDFMTTDLRLQAIFRAVRLVFGDRFAGLRVADLGSLEGGFALAFAQRGSQVTAIEARRMNVQKIRLLREHFQLENLLVEQKDVKAFSRESHGVFDVVLALGILYHLDNPVAWLRQIAEATGRLLIIDTHFAPATDADLKLIDTRIANLSALETVRHGEHEYKGRWFFEYPEGVDREPQLWASWSNNRSFWLTRESLFQAVTHCGFDLVLEQHDYSCGLYHHFSFVFPRLQMFAVRL